MDTGREGVLWHLAMLFVFYTPVGEGRLKGA